jgi:hypothetical protein
VASPSRIRILEGDAQRESPDHPDTLATRGNLARWLGEAGQVGAAKGRFRAPLDAQIRVLGADHPDSFGTGNETGSG